MRCDNCGLITSKPLKKCPKCAFKVKVTTTGSLLTKEESFSIFTSLPSSDSIETLDKSENPNVTSAIDPPKKPFVDFDLDLSETEIFIDSSLEPTPEKNTYSETVQPLNETVRRTLNKCPHCSADLSDANEYLVPAKKSSPSSKPLTDSQHNVEVFEKSVSLDITVVKNTSSEPFVDFDLDLSEIGNSIDISPKTTPKKDTPSEVDQHLKELNVLFAEEESTQNSVISEEKLDEFNNFSSNKRKQSNRRLSNQPPQPFRKQRFQSPMKISTSFCQIKSIPRKRFNKLSQKRRYLLKPINSLPYRGSWLRKVT
tara:strand:+ start:550 stop:1485 length:936 start_codon:yes stop_codon:yes gene_type:complete